mmetsp:Transcript_21958/g.62971  ORF Transcript_21958/g.62971 Transcript_21958/m.62971 type:complete len:152 (-) Transcript_21958:141-596(-)
MSTHGDVIVLRGDHRGSSATAISFEVSNDKLFDELLACIQDEEDNNNNNAIKKNEESAATDGSSTSTVVQRIENIRIQKHVEKGNLRKRRIHHGTTTRTIFSFSTSMDNKSKEADVAAGSNSQQDHRDNRHVNRQVNRHSLLMQLHGARTA